MSMQMDAYLKKEQIGTLFVWGGGPSGVSTPKSKRAIQNKHPPDMALEYLG